MADIVRNIINSIAKIRSHIKFAGTVNHNILVAKYNIAIVPTSKEKIIITVPKFLDPMQLG